MIEQARTHDLNIRNLNKYFVGAIDDYDDDDGKSRFQKREAHLLDNGEKEKRRWMKVVKKEGGDGSDGL